MSELRAAARSLLVGLLVFTLASPALAQDTEEEEGSRLTWNEAHSRADWPHVLATSLVLGAGIAGFIAARPNTPRWTARNDFDDAVRDAFVLPTLEQRETVARITDVVMVSMIAFPVVVDAVISAGFIRQSSDVALQVALISAEPLSLALLVEVLTWQAARERPFVRECAADPDYARGCGDVGGPNPTSFAGGHAMMSFASAGAICAHHTNVPIYGHAGADAAACISAIALATGVALGRLPADRHYLTDTFVGSGLGLAIGWLLPVLVHYHPWASSPSDAQVMVLPGASGSDAGLSLAGVF